jgi:Ca2+-binding RTX toxin-like protein
MSKPPPPPPGLVLNVTTANTTVTGTANHETINALGANDTLIAGPGYEYLNAGGANDTLEGAIGSATFTALAGSSNSTLIALPGLTATVPGVEVHLGPSTIAFARTGVTVSGTDFSNLSFTYQQQFLHTAVNINNVTIDDNGDNVVWGTLGGSTIVVNSNGTNEIFGVRGNNVITVNGNGHNFLSSGAGNTTFTGGTGQNSYLFGDGQAATKSTPSSYFHDTITNFSIANDTLVFQTTQAGVIDAPTSWTLITVNGVSSLHAVLSDGVSTLTLVGVTDPSHIHMENLNDANVTITQLPDVGFAGAAQTAGSVSLLGVSDLHQAHIFA